MILKKSRFVSTSRTPHSHCYSSTIAIILYLILQTKSGKNGLGLLMCAWVMKVHRFRPLIRWSRLTQLMAEFSHCNHKQASILRLGEMEKIKKIMQPCLSRRLKYMRVQISLKFTKIESRSHRIPVQVMQILSLRISSKTWRIEAVAISGKH